MEITPAGKSVRPRRGRGGKCTRSESRRDNFAQEFERLVDELLETLLDDELEGGALGRQVLFRINGEGLPEAALIFDPVTGVKQKLRFRIAGGEAA